MNTNYLVVLKGVGAGYIREDVSKKLAPLFKISVDEANQMLDQHDLVVKKGVGFETAVRYVEALESCGCQCEIQPEVALTIEGTAAAQPSPEVQSEGAERFDSVQETSVTGTTRVAEKSKWTVPKIGDRGKKIVIYGLIGSVLIVSAGYGAIAAYEARERSLVAKKENLVLQKLASVKPSTFDAVKLETKYPAAKPDVLDWSKINAKSEFLNQVLAALQSKDDTTLASFQFEFLSSEYPGGASYELPPGEGEAFSELHDLIEKQPGLALELAEASKRILNNQQIHKADRFGWYNFPDAWYLLAMSKGSRKTLEVYVETKKRERDYEALYDLYRGVNEGFEDMPKAAEYFGLAVQSGNKQVLGVDGFGFREITGKGPKVASAAREAILKARPSANAGNKNDLVSACRDLSSDIVDPLNAGKGVSYDDKPGVELEKCSEALLLDKNNKNLWYQYGYALQRNAYALQNRGELLKAKIAYARAAELGHPMAIARFWRLDFVDHTRERAIKMLQAEAVAGNPWGSYFLGDVFSTSVKDSDGNDSLDYEKSEQAYLKAIDAGLTDAYIGLGAVYFAQNKNQLGLESWQKASDKFPKMAWVVGRIFEIGDLVAADMEMAKRWYKKAAEQGFKEASDALARLENSEKAPTGPVTEWLFVTPQHLAYLKNPPLENFVDAKVELATMYLYGVTVPPDARAARKIFDEAESYWLKNKQRDSSDSSGAINWGKLNDLKKQRLPLIEKSMFANDPVLLADYQELVGEYTKFDDVFCDGNRTTEKNKQWYFACVLDRAIKTGALNSMVVENLKKQGADFSDKAFEQELADIDGPSTSGRNVDQATSGWMRLVEYGLNPNLLIRKALSSKRASLISESINCREMFADFRLAVMLLEKGAAPDGDTYSVIHTVAKNCPEHDGANKFIELAISKGARVDVDVLDDRGNRVKLVDQVLAYGKPKMAAILAKAGAQVDQASLDKETQRLADLRERAERGDHTAQLDLGLYYQAKSDEFAAEPYLRKAANGGLAKAQYEMAFLNHIPGERRHWLEKAADQGYPAAAKMLGRSVPSAPQLSADEALACEYAKERCYEKDGIRVEMCLNALRSIRGCD